MRERDQDLYHILKRGYRRVTTFGNIEVWANPKDPSDFRVTHANPPPPQEVVDAWIEELERMEAPSSPWTISPRHSNGDASALAASPRLSTL